MIRELINFSKSLDDDFKNMGIKAKEGLHIQLHLDENSQISLIHYEYYSKKNDETQFIERMKTFANYAWCIGTDKCLDLPAKGIHSCSPFCVGFKLEFLEGGGKNSNNKEKNKLKINDRLAKYFKKACVLIDNENDVIQPFREIFTLKNDSNYFQNIISEIKLSFEDKRNESKYLIEQIQLNGGLKPNNSENEKIKEQIEKVKKDALQFKDLENSDYVIFYLDRDIVDYKNAYQNYLSENLFLYKDKFITDPDERNQVWGVNAFMNSFNSNMPFLTHQTAPFDISCRLLDSDVKSLFDFEQVLLRNILPRSLPIFIFNEELQQSVIGLFKESSFKLTYRETIEKLWNKHKNDFNNYYILNWQNTKAGLVFQDFDFVSKFEYEFETEILNLFEIKEKGSQTPIKYLPIKTIFELEQKVFKPLIQNKFLDINYFGELKKKEYEGLNNTYQSFIKYRKSVYDYVYKSKRQSINGNMFSDMVFSHIKDDIIENQTDSIKEKLNIWFSLFEKFQTNIKINTPTMASKLKHYQDFVANLSMGKANLDIATDADFAFASGQVIEYLIQKSRSDSKSYQLLEPYLQQAKCKEFKKAIANDIARYKHAINDNETRFKSVCDFVLTYDTDINIKEIMPEILAGVFSKNQFFNKTTTTKEIIN